MHSIAYGIVKVIFFTRVSLLVARIQLRFSEIYVSMFSIFSLHICITGFSLYIPVLLHHSLLSCNGLRECCSYVSRPKIILRDYIGLYFTFRTRSCTRCMKYCCWPSRGAAVPHSLLLYSTVPYGTVPVLRICLPYSTVRYSYEYSMCTGGGSTGGCPPWLNEV